MTIGTLTIGVLAERLTICRLDAHAEIPPWVLVSRPFLSITRTAHELSIVVPTDEMPTELASGAREDGWRALGLVGPFALTEVGVLLRVAAPLAAAGVSILAIATYDTDYVLVHEDRLAIAIEVLQTAGHTVGGSVVSLTVERQEPTSLPHRHTS
jgi:hypothetical protein